MRHKKQLIVSFLILLSVGTAFLVTHRSQKYAQKPVAKLSISKRGLDYFNEIAFGSEFGGNAPVIHKWQKPNVTIAVSGSFKKNDKECLDKVVKDFNDISSEVHLAIAQNSNDINMYFAPEPEFKNIEPNYQPTNYGYFWVSFADDQTIKKSTILISSTMVTDQERCHLIREETTQSMGLMRDSHSYPDSMFYDDWTTTQDYSDLDKQLIEILYGDRGVKANDTPESVAAKVTTD